MVALARLLSCLVLALTAWGQAVTHVITVAQYALNCGGRIVTSALMTANAGLACSTSATACPRAWTTPLAMTNGMGSCAGPAGLCNNVSGSTAILTLAEATNCSAPGQVVYASIYTDGT